MSSKPKTQMRRPPREAGATRRSREMRTTTFERADGTLMRRVGIQLEQRQHAELAILCFRRGVSISEVVRELVEMHLQANQ